MATKRWDPAPEAGVGPDVPEGPEPRENHGTDRRPAADRWLSPDRGQEASARADGRAPKGSPGRSSGAPGRVCDMPDPVTYLWSIRWTGWDG
jgi:hypothetical protein